MVNNKQTTNKNKNNKQQTTINNNNKQQTKTTTKTTTKTKKKKKNRYENYRFKPFNSLLILVQVESSKIIPFSFVSFQHRNTSASIGFCELETNRLIAVSCRFPSIQLKCNNSSRAAKSKRKKKTTQLLPPERL